MTTAQVAARNTSWVSVRHSSSSYLGSGASDRASASLEEAISYSVLGTALYEPLMLALRRLAHQHLLADGLPPRAT